MLEWCCFRTTTILQSAHDSAETCLNVFGICDGDCYSCWPVVKIGIHDRSAEKIDICIRSAKESAGEDLRISFRKTFLDYLIDMSLLSRRLLYTLILQRKNLLEEIWRWLSERHSQTAWCHITFVKKTAIHVDSVKKESAREDLRMTSWYIVCVICSDKLGRSKERAAA